MRNVGEALKIQMLPRYRTPESPATEPHPLPGGVDDLQKILDECELLHHKVLIGLLGLCGARIAEALEVSAESFDIRNKRVLLWGKGEKQRYVPCSEEAWEIFSPAILFGMTGDPKKKLVPMGDRSARQLVTALGVRAKISRPISSHDLRATFATEAYRRTKDLRAVQELLGHSSSTTTEIYTLIDESAKRNAVNIMKGRINGQGN